MLLPKHYKFPWKCVERICPKHVSGSECVAHTVAEFDSPSLIFIDEIDSLLGKRREVRDLASPSELSPLCLQISVCVVCE